MKINSLLEFFKRVVWRPVWRLRNSVIHTYERVFIMPAYAEKRSILKDYAHRYDCKVFVETGTLFGDTVEFLKNEFDRIYSIELSTELARKAAERFVDDGKITILQGNSGRVLFDLVDRLDATTLFWLDGHYSGEFQEGNEQIKTAKDLLNTPILQELTAILRRGLGENVILIDDARLFTGFEDYPTYEALKNMLAKLGVKECQVSRKRDIIRIIPESL